MINRRKIIDFYSTYSLQFDERISSLANYDASYVDFVKQAKNKQNILDLASGPGNVSAYIKKLIPEVEITCVDLSDEMLKIAKNKLTTGNFYKSDILNITIPEKKYDLIICAFGIPYIKHNEVETFVAQINRFSKKDTAVYISCMEGNTISEEMMSFAENKKLTVQRHQKDDIIRAFKQLHFYLTNYRSLDYLEPDGSITKDMIFYFVKK